MKDNLLIKIALTLSIISLIVSVLVFIYKPQPATHDGFVTIQLVDIEGQVISERLLGFNEGDNFFDLLIANYEVTYEESIWGIFLIAINDLDSREGATWYIAIYINNLYSTVGVSQIQLNKGNLISFVMTDWNA